MLPQVDINRLGLVREGRHRGILASGNAEEFDYYETLVSWHGQPREVEVFQSIDQSLLGMELLEGINVVLDANEGGEVIIEEAGTGPAT